MNEKAIADIVSGQCLLMAAFIRHLHAEGVLDQQRLKVSLEKTKDYTLHIGGSDALLQPLKQTLYWLEELKSPSDLQKTLRSIE